MSRLTNIAFITLVIFLLSVSSVSAIPNPASTYCKEQGYTLEWNGKSYDCVLPDGESCNQWDFYRGECGLEYRKKLDCKKAGEEVKTGECCQGLILISNFPTGSCDEFEERGVPIGGWAICSDCGNGICESWENYCNCSKDCKKEKTTYPTKQNQIIPRQTAISNLKKEVEINQINNIEIKNEEKEPIYVIDVDKKGKLLFIIPVKLNLKITLNAKSGEIEKIEKPWWGFLVW